MKAYQSEARRQILQDPVGRRSLRAFLEKRGLAVRQGQALAERQAADVVVTSNGHRFWVRLVPTR
ncbi:MAG TPA: hypothetical protein VH183_08225 [Burkholderiaceae bacterium]|nr:hypothetical protein [Burkholderiaceae bacterium]